MLTEILVAWGDPGGAVQLLRSLLLGAALLHFVVCAVVLCVVDLREHRLPNRWTAALVIGGALTLWPVAWLDARTEGSLSGLLGWEGHLLGSAVAAVGYPLLLWVLRLASRGGLGLGDVKLAAGLGLYAGWLGWESWAQAVFLGFILGGVVALVLVVVRRASGSTRLALGPPLILGALVPLLS